MIDWTRKPSPTWAMISAWSCSPGSRDRACAPTSGVVLKLPLTVEPVEVSARRAA